MYKKTWPLVFYKSLQSVWEIYIHLLALSCGYIFEAERQIQLSSETRLYEKTYPPEILREIDSRSEVKKNYFKRSERDFKDHNAAASKQTKEYGFIPPQFTISINISYLLFKFFL